MNKDIWKYIANCVLCQQEKAKVKQYPLQMTEIPDRPFDKIAINLVTNCETSTSGSKHILTIIDHLRGWPRSTPKVMANWKSFKVFEANPGRNFVKRTLQIGTNT